jgi:ribonucrease Y
MSSGTAATVAIVLALVLVLAMLGLVGWLLGQNRRERHASAAARQASAPTASSATTGELEALAAATAERASAAEQALAAAQTLLGELDLREQRAADREERLAAQSADLRTEATRLATVAADADLRTARLAADERRLAEREERVGRLEEERVAILERTAGLTAEQARAEILAAVESQAKRAAAAHVRAVEREAEREADARARRIVTTAVQRVASDQTAESVVTVLPLPSDDMKGRIIGREGRNIRAFEALTGVNLIIDDTPEAVVLSCFDPVRREIGRLTLESLVLDGRIHPHRIEEVYERSKGEIDQVCQRAAEDALVEVGITDVHPDIVGLLGRLRFRTSYGQNVLGHLVESAHIGGLLAAELGLDVQLVKRCAFLHDIGKALTHETEGSHAIVGAEVARRCGESEAVAHAIEAHHNEVEVRTMEAVLTQAADAVSGGRPGARRESLESYVTRLRRLEEIAGGHDGVDKVYAMQAGHEVRVLVLPDRVDDIGAQVLARDIAKQVEEELTYPGQIKVTVVRESRATEVAR